MTGSTERSSVQPSLATAMLGYEQTLARVQEALSTAGHIGSWQEYPNSMHGIACTSDDGTRGFRSSAGFQTAELPSEQHWLAARDAALAAAAAGGFTDVQTLKDTPGNHVITIYGPDGAQLRLMIGKQTFIDVVSGCLPS